MLGVIEAPASIFILVMGILSDTNKIALRRAVTFNGVLDSNNGLRVSKLHLDTLFSFD